MEEGDNPIARAEGVGMEFVNGALAIDAKNNSLRQRAGRMIKRHLL